MKIDKEKLLAVLKKEAEFCTKEKFNERKTRFYLGRETVLTDMIRQIESGTFDIKEESPPEQYNTDVQKAINRIAPY